MRVHSEARHDFQRGDRILFTNGNRVTQTCRDDSFAENILNVQKVVIRTIGSNRLARVLRVERAGRRVVHLCRWNFK